jgi:hypothetical protein
MKRFSLLCLVLLSACVIQRNVVRQPALTLQVSDGMNPLSNVSIYLYWISDPYSRLEEVQQFVTDAKGEIRLEQLLQSDAAYPLFLHGVTYYQHTLCLQAPGYRTLLITLNAEPNDAINLDTPLTPGVELEICSNYTTLNNHPGVARSDVTKQHESIQGAYEVTQ